AHARVRLVVEQVVPMDTEGRPFEHLHRSAADLAGSFPVAECKRAGFDDRATGVAGLRRDCHFRRATLHQSAGASDLTSGQLVVVVVILESHRAWGQDSIESEVEHRSAVIEESAVAEEETGVFVPELPALGRAHVPGRSGGSGPGHGSSGELEREGLGGVVVDELEAGSGRDTEIRRTTAKSSLVAKYGESLAGEDFTDWTWRDGHGSCGGEAVGAVHLDEVRDAVTGADEEIGSSFEGEGRKHGGSQFGRRASSHGSSVGDGDGRID